MRYLSIFLLFFGCRAHKPDCVYPNPNKYNVHIEKTDSKQINLIPKVQEIEVTQGNFIISDNTCIISDSLFLEESKYLKNLLNLSIYEQKNAIILKKRHGLQEEEFYLNITHDKLQIEATTREGIMRGIQTLRQLLPIGFEKNGGQANIQCLSIHDFPRFEWRGMLLDCCRHFMDKEFVMRYIDLLAYHKMNILHWHLTEDQGWRIAIDKYPKLTEIGAWRIEKDGSIYGGFYTKEDIKEIIEYASVRHITIVPEIELPGHSSAAIASYPYLSCTNDSIVVPNDWGVFKDIYCAGNDSVFYFLEDILTEVIDLFPSKYIHIGGDEVPKYKWENCKKCKSRIQEEELDDSHGLQSYFIKRIELFLNKNGRKLIGWDEILEGGLAPSATVQSWRGIEGGITAAKNGHDAIMSPTSHCYFDYGLDAIDMEKVYFYNPIPESLNEEEKKHILGGECNMWTERAPQETIDSKVFPRILAMSEVLWSNSEKDYNDFYERVQQHYSRLDELGVTYGLEGVPIKSEIGYLNDEFLITLIPGNPSIKLEYSVDSFNWNKYTNPFTLNKSSNIYARGFKNEEEYGNFKQQVIKSKSTGKNVTYIIPYSQYYQGKKEKNLTDGLVGSSDNFRDGYYQGFWGTNFDVIIDLGEISKFSEIHATFFQYYLSWIILPTSVNYFISDDGKNFTEIATISNKVDIMKDGKFKYDFSIKNKNLTGRYVKVTANNVGKLPKNHPAAGSDAWIFIDEIIIN